MKQDEIRKGDKPQRLLILGNKQGCWKGGGWVDGITGRRALYVMSTEWTPGSLPRPGGAPPTGCQFPLNPLHQSHEVDTVVYLYFTDGKTETQKVSPASA